jgi:lysophospholipase L1-like esterase
MLIHNNDIVLFQGDSITDAGRSRENTDDLGYGYASLAANLLTALYPEVSVKFLNRGISGNRVIDLKERWKEDCLDLKPTWLSVMIGINDCWRRYDGNDLTSPENFEKNYRDILKRSRESLNARLILMEPFVLPFPEDRKAWREDLDPKIEVVRGLAEEFGALLVPLDGVMNDAASHRDPSFWAGDGVHPSPAGHALIAAEWLKAVEAF